MTDKTKAFIRLISIVFRGVRQDDRPLRNDLIWSLLRDGSLRYADSIELNPYRLRVIRDRSSHDFRWDRQPLTSDELEALRQVLIMKLPRSMGCVAHLEEGEDKESAWAYVYAKTEV